MDTSIWNLLAAAALGYFSGSLSGARIVGRIVGSGDLASTNVVLDGTGTVVETHGISPSALQARGGAKAGLPAGAIDITKALVPTLLAATIWPDSPAYIVTATTALIGHVYPIYHHFVGGYGISPLLGGLVVIDWRAPVVAIVFLGLVGLVAGSAFVAIETWPVALIPWFAWQTGGWAVVYALVANAIYWWRSRDEAIGAYRSYRRDVRGWKERVADFKTYPDYEVPP